MKRRLAFLLAGLALCGPARAEEAAAQALAAEFCRAVQMRDEAAAEALMTAELQAAIASLRAADAEFRAASPDEKPPLGDGLRLTAFPDSVESCTASEITSESVALTYAPAGAPDAVWRDQLLLVPAGGGLRIADILFGPDGSQRFSRWLAASALD